MLIVAIDPGVAGALAIIAEHEVILITDLPIHHIGVANKRALRSELDLHRLHELLVEHAPFNHAFVEKVGTRQALRSELDLHRLHELLVEHAPFHHAFVEKVGTRPGQGIVGAFRFGVACGSIIGMLVALGVPLTLVQPKEWQRYHGIGPAPDAARQCAAQLFPAVAPRLALKRDEHRADALLIAAYGMSRLAVATPQSQG